MAMLQNRSSKQVRRPDADVASERRGGHRERAGEVEFPGSTTALEVSIDRRNGHLVRRDGDAGPSTDASATTRVDEFHTDFEEEVMPTHAFGQRLDLT